MGILFLGNDSRSAQWTAAAASAGLAWVADALKIGLAARCIQSIDSMLSRARGYRCRSEHQEPLGDLHPGRAARGNLKSCAGCHAVAKEHHARRATSATLTSGVFSSTVQTSARHVGPISTRFR
ncbi:MAG: hypothetical protein M3O36_04945 [Myxococcota bacterium]|nr:hypothetical protein [Myxococcota bacterium]